MARLRSLAFDVVVAGQGNNGSDPLKLLRRVRAIRPDARVIVTGERGSGTSLGRYPQPRLLLLP